MSLYIVYHVNMKREKTLFINLLIYVNQPQMLNPTELDNGNTFWGKFLYLLN